MQNKSERKKRTSIATMSRQNFQKLVDKEVTRLVDNKVTQLVDRIVNQTTSIESNNCQLLNPININFDNDMPCKYLPT